VLVNTRVPGRARSRMTGRSLLVVASESFVVMTMTADGLLPSMRLTTTSKDPLNPTAPPVPALEFFEMKPGPLNVIKRLTAGGVQ